MVPEGSHGVFKHGKDKPIHVFDYTAEREVVVIKEALEDEFISGFFHKLETYEFLAHRVLYEFAVIGAETFFGGQPDYIIPDQIMRNIV